MEYQQLPTTQEINIKDNAIDYFVNNHTKRHLGKQVNKKDLEYMFSLTIQYFKDKNIIPKNHFYLKNDLFASMTKKYGNPKRGCYWNDSTLTNIAEYIYLDALA